MIEILRELIKDKNVLILGYGREGRSSWRRIKEAGGFNEAAVADLNPISLGADDPDRLICGPDYQKRMNDFDIVFKSPGIVLERNIQSYTCKIVSQTEVFFSKYSQQCIGITGTKGKSTTTTLLYHILKESGKDCLLAGNIGIPVFDLIDEIHSESVIVCELSCHQLEYASCVPHIGLLLNIHEEHLDHYGTMEKYVAAKENIYRPQHSEDILICGTEVIPVINTCKSRIITVSDGDIDQSADVVLNRHTIHMQQHDFVIPTEGISLIGHHNYLDIAFVYAVCSLYGVSDEIFTKGLISYQPLPHRLQFVGERKGIRFYDDSISTICETTIQALNSIPNTDAILIGGMDRGIDYKELIDFLSQSEVPHIILMEATGKRIAHEITTQKTDFQAKNRIHLTEHLDDAVFLAKQLCRPGTACVLSPAAASYGIFINFEERGDVFAKLALGE